MARTHLWQRAMVFGVSETIHLSFWGRHLLQEVRLDREILEDAGLGGIALGFNVRITSNTSRSSMLMHDGTKIVLVSTLAAA
jgi:hypothetical protein